MAIKTNKSTEKVVQERKLYTGLCDMEIVAINPDVKELDTISIKTDKEPSYEIEVNGNPMQKIVFYLKSNDILTKVDILLSKEKRVAKSGAKQWINAYAQSCFADRPDAYTWFKQEGVREAYEGEVDLYNFIKAWGNVAPADTCVLDTMDKIVKGDVKELRGYMKQLKDNTLKVLLGVNEYKGKYYQGVYNRFFGRTSTENLEGWKKQLTGDYGEFKKHDWQNDFMFKEWKQGTSINTVSPTDESDLAAQEKAAEAGF